MILGDFFVLTAVAEPKGARRGSFVLFEEVLGFVFKILFEALCFVLVRSLWEKRCVIRWLLRCAAPV